MILGRLALDTADRSHRVQDFQRGSEPVLQPRRFPDVADVGTDDLKKSLYACFFSTSKNNRQLSHNMRHLQIIFAFLRSGNWNLLIVAILLGWNGEIC